MPPKKKGNEKNSAVPSSAVTDNDVEIVVREVNFEEDEQKAIQFSTDPSSDVLEVWTEIYEKAQEKILENHIKTHLDNFTASAACNAITDLTDWLYLSYQKDAPLEDHKTIVEPTSLKIDAWAENAVHQDVPKITNTYSSLESGKTAEMQNFLSVYGCQNHFENLPNWMKPTKKTEESKPSTPIHEQINQMLKKNNKNKHKVSKRYSLKKKVSNPDFSKEATDNSIKSCPPVSNSKKPVKGSPGRLRQFRRRKEQEQATQKSVPKADKLAPMTPQSARQTGINFPTVQILDPLQEAADNRRNALKTGQLRPQTKSEVKLIESNRPKMKKLLQKQKLPGVFSNQSVKPSFQNTNMINQLPETLIDSLTVSDMLPNVNEKIQDDFDKLNAVSIH